MQRFLTFIAALIGINLILWAVGSPMRISIIGSILLTLVVGGVMAATNKRSA